MSDTKVYHSGFVALVGRPNAGKSTLLNTLIGEELALVSPLPQTTQKNMRGILTGEGWQIVFVDTPGMHQGRHEVNDAMLKRGRAMLSDDEGTDIVFYLVDLSRPAGSEEDLVAGLVRKSRAKVCVLFNKADLCEDPHAAVEAILERYTWLADAPRLVVSANKKETKEKFLALVKPMLPEGPQFFPEDDLSDAGMRHFAAEFVRKQVIALTREEVPHAVCVEIVRYRETDRGHEIDATIHVETQGQKGIIVGKGGVTIGKIRTGAQADIAKLADAQVRLTLFVSVTPKWRDNGRFLREMGFDR